MEVFGPPGSMGRGRQAGGPWEEVSVLEDQADDMPGCPTVSVSTSGSMLQPPPVLLAIATCCQHVQKGKKCSLK